MGVYGKENLGNKLFDRSGQKPSILRKIKEVGSDVGFYTRGTIAIKKYETKQRIKKKISNIIFGTPKRRRARTKNQKIIIITNPRNRRALRKKSSKLKKVRTNYFGVDNVEFK